MFFCADYPFGTMEDAANWYDASEAIASEGKKFGRANAIELFKLDPD